MITLPVPQLVMSQMPPRAPEQSTTQLDPGSHDVWQGGDVQTNAHALPGPQEDVPSQNSPEHVASHVE